MMENEKILIPTNCPSCGSVLEDVNGQLFCRNIECSAQNTKSIEHFCKVLKIKGMGPKTIQKLEISNIADIYAMYLDSYIEALGEKVGTKLYKEIRDSTKADLQLVLQALGIPRIGETASKKICKVVSHITEINKETCKLAGLGEVDTNNLVGWLSNNDELLSSLPFDYKSTTKQNDIKSLGTVCITGSLKNYKNRNEAKTFLESHGYTVVETVSSKVMALICEEDKDSSKTLQAKAKNIPILTIEKLLEKDNIKI